MNVRTALAALDHNANCNRPQKQLENGQLAYRVKVFQRMILIISSSYAHRYFIWQHFGTFMLRWTGPGKRSVL